MKFDVTAVPHVTRIRMLVLALLVLNAFCTNLTHSRYNLNLLPHVVGEDDITAGEDRFEELRKVLPARATVGYVNDRADETEDLEAFFIARYALAPNIVVRETWPELVVGDFRRPGAGIETLAGLNLIVVRDFGNGVMLLGREGR
ncbi:MAG: hypothetical protein ABW250_27140 [Pyrinomonadaceae bacterium]